MATVSLKPEATSRSIGMLRTAMGAAITGWLDDPAIVEIMLNPDGRLWIDRLAGGLSATGKRLSAQDGERIVALADSDLHVGLGLTTRKNAELCLPGRRGSAGCNAKDVREIILAPVREHSRDEARERSNCDGPYVDLVAPATNENRVAVAAEDGDAA